MLTYELSRENTLPLYQQLYLAIKNDIEKGILPKNQQLPSKRKLALHLNVSLITVVYAYEQLMLEGYIYAKNRRGYFVGEISYLSASSNTQESELPKEKTETFEIDLVANILPKELFPFKTWSKMMRKVLNEDQEELLKRIDNKGNHLLRQAIAAYLRSYKQINADEEQIIIAAGSEQLYNKLIMLFGNKYRYGIENPGYPSIRKTLELHHCSYELLAIDEQGAKLPQHNAQIIHLSPAHQFPTGKVMLISRRRQMLNYVKKHNGIIIEDDYDSEFRLKGQPVKPLYSLADGDYVIYMNTFSKSLAPSIRLSYMVLPKTILKEYEAKMGFLSSDVSTLDQLIVAHFMADGYYERHIARIRNYYRNIRNLLIKRLYESPLKDDITIAQEDAGLHFLITFKKEKKAIRDKRLRIAALSKYGDNDQSGLTYVLNYSSLNKEKIDLLIDLLCQ